MDFSIIGIGQVIFYLILGLILEIAPLIIPAFFIGMVISGVLIVFER